MIILGIETSCDETSIAILESKNGQFKILSNLVSSQINIHKKYGGIVPEVAARKHIEVILPLIDEALKSLKKIKIDYIATTYGPGLITSLLIGIETAKTLSYVWQKPLIGINHLEGHIYANWLSPEKDKIKFPALCLVVSGGHTELVLMKN
ncbi:MAG: tRNA (adenosine(37)-N6)-threonylcarbamoyltransferase complex transferase subunit TsaD, partial [Patescibacteria group bacterium]|nr:tRNA (adenosine(37)-N6)-threonylcarbamoyltransferase complex transferase subunit TsaD [Patescibacteria group bacterium]